MYWMQSNILEAGMSYYKLHNNPKGSPQLNSIRQLRHELLNDNNPVVQLIRNLLLIQIAMPIKTLDLIQLRWEHIHINDSSIVIYKVVGKNTFSTPCFFYITGEILSYLNGLRQLHNDSVYVFGPFARMPLNQRKRLVYDYIKKSGIRLSVDLKYLHRFFSQHACKSFFNTKFITSFMKGEIVTANSQRIARIALMEWWGEQILTPVTNLYFDGEYNPCL